MSKLLTCDEGGSVTCAILQLAEDIRDTPGLLEFESWVTLWIPLLAAVASTAVAVVSVLIANRAREIAEESEKARGQAETDRANLEYESRMHRAQTEIFNAIAVLATQLQEHGQRLQHIATERHQYVPSTERPIEPSDAILLADIAAARLLARSEEEVALMNAIREGVLASRVQFPALRAAVLSEAWRLVILWRGQGPEGRAKLFADFQNLKRMDRVEDVPAWTV